MDYREIRNDIRRSRKMVYLFKVIDILEFELRVVKFFLEEIKE